MTMRNPMDDAIMFSFKRRREEGSEGSPCGLDRSWHARSPGLVDKALSFLWLGEPDWAHSARDATSEYARVRHRMSARDDGPSPPA